MADLFHTFLCPPDLPACCSRPRPPSHAMDATTRTFACAAAMDWIWPERLIRLTSRPLLPSSLGSEPSRSPLAGVLLHDARLHCLRLGAPFPCRFLLMAASNLSNGASTSPPRRCSGQLRQAAGDLATQDAPASFLVVAEFPCFVPLLAPLPDRASEESAHVDPSPIGPMQTDPARLLPCQIAAQPVHLTIDWALALVSAPVPSRFGPFIVFFLPVNLAIYPEFAVLQKHPPASCI